MRHRFCPYRDQFLIIQLLSRKVPLSPNLRKGTEQLRFCSLTSRGFIKFLCWRSVGFFSRANWWLSLVHSRSICPVPGPLNPLLTCTLWKPGFFFATDLQKRLNFMTGQSSQTIGHLDPQWWSRISFRDEQRKYRGRKVVYRTSQFLVKRLNFYSLIFSLSVTWFCRNEVSTLVLSLWTNNYIRQVEKLTFLMKVNITPHSIWKVKYMQTSWGDMVSRGCMSLISHQFLLNSPDQHSASPPVAGHSWPKTLCSCNRDGNVMKSFWFSVVGNERISISVCSFLFCMD